MTVLIDELLQLFGPPLFVAPYGQALVIQGPEFDKSWKDKLAAEGYRCIFSRLDKHPVVFVPLKKQQLEASI